MKISKITWVQDKLNKLFICFLQSGSSLTRLLCSSCVVIVTSGCSFWPDTADRELSISHRSAALAPGMDSEYLAHLLEVSKKRYVELKNAGAEYCLPGQMLKITKKQDLIEHEIDGSLLSDARIHMKDVFEHLYNIKNQVENNNPSKKCYEYFSIVHKDAVPISGVWESSVEIDALMEGK